MSGDTSFGTAVVRQVRNVSADGRVAIPYIFQLALDVERGGQVEFVLENGGVTIRATSKRAGAADCPARLTGTSLWADIRAELHQIMSEAGIVIHRASAPLVDRPGTPAFHGDPDAIPRAGFSEPAHAPSPYTVAET